MTANGRLGLCESEKQAITLERKPFSEICKLKTYGVGEDHAGKFNLSQAHRTLALDWYVTHTYRQRDRHTDYSNSHAHAHQALITRVLVYKNLP